MRRHRVVSMIVIIVVMALLTLSGTLRRLSDRGRGLTLPVLQKLSAVPRFFLLREMDETFQHSQEARVAQLQRQLASHVVDVTLFQALKEENEQLRAQAAFLKTSGFTSVGARVISRDVRSDRALLLIDRGRRDHVEVGQPAIVANGILIGKVRSIQEHVSTVELLTDVNSRIAVSPHDQRRLVGIIEGRGHGAAVLTYIPSSESLVHDQILVTAGTEDKIPQNLPLAIINAVEGKTTDPFLTASVDPLVALDRILLVSILQPEASHIEL